MAAKPNDKTIYKIMTSDQWAELERLRVFKGAPIDLTDGYIHFSRAEQVRETAAKHFSGQTDLHLVGVSTALIAADLIYEPSRGGQLFPHLYGDLPVSAVVSVEPLRLDADGVQTMPDGIP